MENKKDIGKAISDKLSSLDKTPKEQVWSGISYELQKKKKRRAGFFFFWAKIIGVVLIGAIAAFYIYERNTGYNFFSPENSKDSVIINSVNGETITINPNRNKNSQTQENTVVGSDNLNTINGNSDVHNKNNTAGKNAAENKNSINNQNNALGKNGDEKNGVVNNRNKNGSVNAVSGRTRFNSISSKSGSKTGSFSKGSGATSLSKAKAGKSGKKWAKKSKTKKGKSKKDKTGSLLSETKPAENNSAIIDLSSLQNKNSTEKSSEIKAKKTDSVVAKKQKDKVININMYPKDSVATDSAKTYRKFYVDAFVSPTLYGSFSKGSVLDRSLDTLTKKSEIKFSFGAGITYDLNQKISVRIGFQKINISYITKNAYFTGESAGQISNYSGIDYNPNVSNQSIYNAANFPPEGAAKMDIIQKISYTEIPLEVKYLFLDKKIGLKSSFGFSFLTLNENKVSIKTSNGFSQDIGKTKGLSANAISVNLGIEADYTLFKNTKIFIEPMFNYQLKAFSDGNYKPYIFGIHTGIRYCFNNKN